MAQRFGGKYSADGRQSVSPRAARAEVNPVGGRANALFIPPILLVFMSLNDGALGLVLGLMAATVLSGAARGSEGRSGLPRSQSCRTPGLAAQDPGRCIDRQRCGTCRLQKRPRRRGTGSVWYRGIGPACRGFRDRPSDIQGDGGRRQLPKGSGRPCG